MKNTNEELRNLVQSLNDIAEDTLAFEFVKSELLRWQADYYRLVQKHQADMTAADKECMALRSQLVEVQEERDLWMRKYNLRDHNFKNAERSNAEFQKAAEDFQAKLDRAVNLLEAIGGDLSAHLWWRHIKPLLEEIGSNQ